MKQGLSAVLLVGAVVVALGLGFFGGQIWKGGGSSVIEGNPTASLEDLTRRVAALERTGPTRSSSSGDFKIAYVDMFKVLADLKDSPLVKASLEQYQLQKQKIDLEREELNKKFQQGELSKKQLDEEVEKLLIQLQELNLKLSAPIQRQMLEIIQQIGQERGYSLIIDNPASQLNPTVLYSQAGGADDITPEVITRLSAQLRQNESP
jgi:Skp family chaperone for outer membrane proteins